MMNYRRGLRRITITAICGWEAVAAVRLGLIVWHWTSHPFWPTMPFFAGSYRTHAIEWAVAAVAGPLVITAAGAAANWIVTGFDPNSDATR